LGARAAAGHRRRRIPRREIAGESETGATVLGLDCGLAMEVHQGTRNPLGRLAGFGGVLRGSPWRRAALARRRAAFQCFLGLRTTTPSAKRTGEGCRCSPGLDWVGDAALVVCGVSLAAELDGAWRRGRRGAFPGTGSAGGVRAGPAKVVQGPNKSNGHRS